MPAGYWIAVAIQVVVFVLMLIDRKRMEKENQD